MPALALTERSIDKVVNKAQRYFEGGDTQGMLRLRDELLNLAPGSPELDFVTGSLHRLMGLHDQAYTAFSRAVQKDPSKFLPEFSRDLADLAIQVAHSSRSHDRRRELLEDALWYLDQEMESAPDPTELLFEKVKLLFVLNRPDEAKTLCVEQNVVSVDADASACLRELLSSAEETPADTTVRTVNPEVDDGSVTLPVLWWKAPPVFPELARLARIEGRVVLQAIVSRDGTVNDLEVLACDRPGLGFEESAQFAVRQWRYLPAMKGDEPVDVDFTVQIDFELE
jgi:TonB family protein